MMREHRLALLILLSAFLLRIAFPTWIEFKRDEATVVREALAIAHGHLTPFGVGSSVGTANAPLFLYLAALPLRLWPDPVALFLFIAVLNSLAIAATWWMVRRYLSPRAALIAAWLFALSGWAVVYGRKIWTRTLPLVTLGFFIVFLAFLIRRRPYALVGTFVALAALVGLQLEGLAFVVILGLLLLLYRHRVRLGELTIGAFLFLLAFLPYLVADARLGWPNLRGLLAYAEGNARWSIDSLRYAFRLIGSRGMEGLAGPFAIDFIRPLTWLRPLEGLMTILLIGGLLHALWRSVRGEAEERPFFAVLLIWFSLPILLQSRTTQPTQPHYFVLLYPVQFILIAAWLDHLLHRLPALPWRMLSSALIASWSVGQLLALGMLMQMMRLHPSTGGYGIPLHYPRQAVREALRCATTIVALGESADPRYEEVPAVFDALLFEQDHRLADADLALPLPDAETTGFLLGPVRGEDDFRPLRTLLAYVAEPYAQLSLPDGPRYLVACRHRADRDDLIAGWVRVDLPLADGAVIAAYRSPPPLRPGSMGELWVAWWVREPPSPLQTTQFYLHLLDAEGKLVAQQDANGYPVEQWQRGDFILSRLPFTVPLTLSPGEYRLRVGLYTLPEVRVVPIVAADGKPIDDGFWAGLLTVTAP